MFESNDIHERPVLAVALPPATAPLWRCTGDGLRRRGSSPLAAPAAMEAATLDALPAPDAAPLEEVLVTDALARRAPRPPDHASEVTVLHRLAHALAGPPEALLRILVEEALWLCDAGTSGVSLLEPDAAGGGERFRWTVLAGALAGAVGGTTPRDFSPCGVCLDEGRAVLFSHPERRFTYFRSAGVPFVEGLVLPFSVAGRPAGTIWVVTHRESRRFDLEDVRLMSALAGFTGAAYALMRRAS